MPAFPRQELAQRKALVLTALVRGCRPGAAAQAAGVAHGTVCMWRGRDAAFDRDWRRAYRKALAAALPPRSDGTRAKVLFCLRQGLPGDEAARQAGVSTDVVSAWRRRHEGFAAEW